MKVSRIGTSVSRSRRQRRDLGRARNSTAKKGSTLATFSSLLLRTVSRLHVAGRAVGEPAMTRSWSRRTGACSGRGPGPTRCAASLGRSAGSSDPPPGDPVADQRQSELFGAEPLAPFMRDHAAALLHDQAGFGVARVGPPAGGVASQIEVVGRQVEPWGAEPEAVLARGRAVAGAGVAARGVHGGDDLAAEADRVGTIEPGDRHGHAHSRPPSRIASVVRPSAFGVASAAARPRRRRGRRPRSRRGASGRVSGPRRVARDEELSGVPAAGQCGVPRGRRQALGCSDGPGLVVVPPEPARAGCTERVTARTAARVIRRPCGEIQA